MPLNLPQTMQTLLTGDSAASRGLQLAKNAVDPLLGFVNGTFQVMTDGGLRVVRNLVTSAFKADTTDAGVLTASSAQVNGPLNVTGQSNFAAIKAVGINYIQGFLILQKNADNSGGSLLAQGNLSVTDATVNGNLNTTTGVKTALGQFGVSGNTGAGSYYNLGAAYYSNNYQVRLPWAGSLVGASIMLYSGTAMTISTFYTGLLPGEYRRDTYCAANTYVVDSFVLAKGTYTFQPGYTMVFKAYTPVAGSGVSITITPYVEFAVT